jgi:hypothetical protein
MRAWPGLALVLVLAACGSGSATVDATPGVGTLFVNEVMPSNATACADPFGEYDDWIELYNAGTEELDLTGFFVTDDLTMPMREQLPAGLTVPAHGFKLLWADDQVEGVDHLKFKLEAKGEMFGISAPDGTLLDMITFGAATADVSFARLPDGTGDFVSCAKSTCGASNGTTCQ